MAVRIDKGTALASLSITPLIDIVFLLLIFFLVATRFAEEDRELEVSLPSASEAKPLIVKPRDVFVDIDRKGQYFLDGHVLPARELANALAQAATDNPANQAVIIRADRRCRWNDVSLVINACHRAGIRDVRPTAAADNGE